MINAYFYCCHSRSVFLKMIQANELRLGNYLMQKVNNRIVTLRCTYDHFQLLANGGKDFYPVVLKAELLEKAGFTENKNYVLLPAAREFRLLLPVMGGQANEICAYIKSNGECFARGVVNDAVVSNNFYHLHQLQNLCFALSGRELPLNL
jgi:hypothetical protein